ncbi:MAG: response regulator [Chloroflexi bacterium]|nr:response regulator [Chloroflexota bacterium]
MERHQKILLIDDDPDFVEATTTVLQSKDYQVVSALSPEVGLQKAREEKPDLIILDIIMPAKDGFAVCEQLKADPTLSKIPVIILTSMSQRVGESTVAMSQGLRLEAEDYLDKPVEPKVLLSRVENLLKKK